MNWNRSLRLGVYSRWKTQNNLYSKSKFSSSVLNAASCWPSTDMAYCRCELSDVVQIILGSVCSSSIGSPGYNTIQYFVTTVLIPTTWQAWCEQQTWKNTLSQYFHYSFTAKFRKNCRDNCWNFFWPNNSANCCCQETLWYFQFWSIVLPSKEMHQSAYVTILPSPPQSWQIQNSILSCLHWCHYTIRFCSTAKKIIICEYNPLA